MRGPQHGSVTVGPSTELPEGQVQMGSRKQALLDERAGGSD